MHVSKCVRVNNFRHYRDPKHSGLYLQLNNKGKLNVAFSIKGSIVLTLVWIFKRISLLCFGKKYITFLRWLFLTSLRFYELVREILRLYGWFCTAFVYLQCLRLLAQVSQTGFSKYMKSTDCSRLSPGDCGAGTGISPP